MFTMGDPKDWKEGTSVVIGYCWTVRWGNFKQELFSNKNNIYKSFLGCVEFYFLKTFGGGWVKQNETHQNNIIFLYSLIDGLRQRDTVFN